MATRASRGRKREGKGGQERERAKKGLEEREIIRLQSDKRVLRSFPR